jgi:hypothetical protein
VKVLESKTPLDQAVASALAQKFHHNDFEWISSSDSTEPNWKTRTDRSLSLGELVREYLDIEKLIGVGFGKTTKYAMLDLDWTSKYHPAYDIDAFIKLLHTLEQIGLTRYIVIQSSHSRGLHIYFPLPKAVKTYHLAASIRITLINAGFEIKNGQLEIFPNCKRYAKAKGDYSHYKPHRLPLQPNSGSWLMEDDGLNPQFIPDNIEAQLEALNHQWEWAAQGQDRTLLERKLPELYQKYKTTKHKYQDRAEDWQSDEAQKWQKDLELTIKVGWTEFAMTYILLPKFLAYGVVFLKLEGQELYDWMYQAIVTAPGYRQYCQHQHEIEKLIASWIKTNERTGYYSPYRSYPDREQTFPFGKTRKAKKVVRKINSGNIRRADEAKSRIEGAYENLKEEFTAETKITEMRERLRAKIQEMYEVGIGTDTLTRHKNIWHPEFNIPENTSLEGEIERSPESLLAEDKSESAKTPENSQKQAQSGSLSKSDYSKIPMICGEDRPQLDRDPSQLNTDLPPTISTQPHSLEDGLVLAEERESSTYTHHYNLRPDEVVTQQPKPGKFEVLGATLSKIATLAALVANMVAGIKLEPQPTEEAEIEPDAVTPDADEKIAPPSSVTTPERAEETSLRPCDDPCILPLYIVRYNPNQTGVPWTTHDEFHKFVAFLVNIAKQDPSISNPYYWAIHTVQNFKDRGVNPHWLAFTGQELPYWLKPKEGAVEEQLPPTPPSPTAATVEPPCDLGFATGIKQPTPDISPPEPSKPPAAQNRHAHGKNCPKCKIPTPLEELERWKVCRFCASTSLFKRKR